ncbi:MAG: hypothetical protein ABSE16_16250 [Verrucomicrobiota bacterium]|jgi:hypothetical protein
MKTLTPLTLLLAGILAAGCASHQAKTAKAKPAHTPQPVVQPDTSLAARVVDYNAEGRFVVLTFPVGQMPKLEQTLYLYHAGLKVAQVIVTGPQQDNNIVADLVSGEAQAGDEARDQ